MTRLLVLGLGNPLLGDDGVGPRAVSALAEETLPEGAVLRDGGTGGLFLLPDIEDAERVVLIDAIDIEAAPGTVRRFERDEIPRASARGLSAHDVGLKDLLALCELRGTLPARVVLLGVQVERLVQGEGLSPAVEAALPELLRAVRAELRSFEECPA